MSHDPNPSHPPAAPAGDRADWGKPLPELIPPPTYAPALMASGIVLLAWGVTTIWVVSAVGLGLMIFALTMWIRAIRKDWNINK